MKQLLFITGIFLNLISIGQITEKGIYKGRRFPFTICYFTNNDSTIEVEYFFMKASQIFDREPPKKLIPTNAQSSRKPVFKSADDSITVFSKKTHYLVKSKAKSYKVKLYKSNDTFPMIIRMRNENSLYRFYQNLYREYNKRPDFDQTCLNEEFQSYELYKYISTLDEKEFNKKIEAAYEDIKKKMP